MAKPHFVWLGSGRSKRRKVQGPAHWLDEAARARLPVTPGAILTDEFYHFCQEHDLVSHAGTAVFVTDAELLHNTLFHSIHLPRFDRPVTLRPSLTAAAPDGDAARRPFDSADPQALAAALAAAWSDAPADPAVRRDVYLLETLDTPNAGLAQTTPDDEMDVVRTASDDSPVTPIVLPRLSRWGRPDEDTPPYLGRLQQLLRGLRRTLGDAGWMVTWADDGAIAWVTGIYAHPAGSPPPDEPDPLHLT